MAGFDRPKPQEFEHAVLLALPLAILRLPRLFITDVGDWLSKYSLQFTHPLQDRDLHACLVARNGAGYVLLNGTDEPSEARYSLAHEVSHFVLDYYLPRERAVERLGPSILDVLDGRRPVTPTDRVQAVIADVSLQHCVHLLER